MNHDPGHGDSGPMAMMTLMMAMCVGIFLLAALIPTLGFPVGLVVAVAVAALAVIGHRKLMGHR